jgi:hypothetical protein
LALVVPLSRFTSRVGGGSAFFVRPHDTLMRLALIIGAAICLVIGLQMTFVIFWYHIPFEFIPYLYTVVAFVPLILLAPRSSTPKKRRLFTFLAVTEIVIIGMSVSGFWKIR